jgi:alcohol dehydrogenase class IV
LDAHEGAAVVDALQDVIGVPTRLRDVDVERDETAFREMAEIAVNDFAMASNPRPVAVDDIERILDDAW